MADQIQEILTARWDDDREQYVLGLISSADGDNWISLDGQPVAGTAFETLTIRLVGGPRDGDVVA